MLHSKHITLAANKTEAQATRTWFKVNKGVIYRVWLEFPPGCKVLVKFRMYLDEHPILPVEKDAYIVGNAYTFVYPLMVEIKTEPQTITIESWNTDEVYNHTINVQLLIIPKEWVQPVGASEGIIAALRSLFQQRS